MEKYFEDLLQHYDKLSDAEKNYWYKARHYVLNIMEPLDGDGISPKSSDSVHVVVKDIDNPLVQAVVRQICLIAHYPNFNEDKEEDKDIHRTLITIYSDNPENTYNDLNDNRVLGNLLDYCKCNIEPEKATRKIVPLDIEFEFLHSGSCSTEGATAIISTDELKNCPDDFDREMDVTKGILVNMVYSTGAVIGNLPATDNANIKRYSTALNVFCYNLKSDRIYQKWCECKRVKDKLSSVFCADCFEARIKGLVNTKEKTLVEYILKDFDTVMKKVCDENTLTALARCEHSRWNVEKLILDFLPLHESDWYELENCFGEERKNKIKVLKKELNKHIDLCSYKDLRRIDPANIKYDYFLMLAMPQIMRSYLLIK